MDAAGAISDADGSNKGNEKDLPAEYFETYEREGNDTGRCRGDHSHLVSYQAMGPQTGIE